MGVNPTAAPEQDPVHLLEQELSVLVRRARRFSKEVAQGQNAELEPEAYVLLVRIASDTDVRVTDLASYLGVGKPTVSRQLQMLERLGLLSKAVDPEDSRSSRLHLTAEGRALLDRATATRREFITNRFQGWNDDDKQTFARLLAKFNRADEAGSSAEIDPPG